VYRTWSECQSQVERYNGAVFKSFADRDDALSFSRRGYGGASSSSSAQVRADFDQFKHTVSRSRQRDGVRSSCLVQGDDDGGLPSTSHRPAAYNYGDKDHDVDHRARGTFNLASAKCEATDARRTVSVIVVRRAAAAAAPSNFRRPRARTAASSLTF
jgi:Caulimovirus viroplasmin